MPGLDVSFMTADPMLADVFDVTRRAETVNSKGRTTVTNEFFTSVVGVVTQQSPADLMRAPEGQIVPRRIMVCTQFALRGAVVGYQPDLITWNGTQYLVTEVLPYSRFGEGTYEVVAESQQAQDVPQ
jgi:hypothetical protein